MSADFDNDSADSHNDAENRRRAAEQWPGFDPDEALHWSKVLLHHSPRPTACRHQSPDELGAQTRHSDCRTGLGEYGRCRSQ